MAVCGQCHRERSAYRLDAAVQRQFAENQAGIELAPFDEAGGGQNADGDRKVERGAAFSDVRRGEVYRDAVGRKLEARISDRASYTIPAFTDTGIREADHREHR